MARSPSIPLISLYSKMIRRRCRYAQSNRLDRYRLRSARRATGVGSTLSLKTPSHGVFVCGVRDFALRLDPLAFNSRHSLCDAARTFDRRLPRLRSAQPATEARSTLSLKTVRRTVLTFAWNDFAFLARHGRLQFPPSPPVGQMIMAWCILMIPHAIINGGAGNVIVEHCSVQVLSVLKASSISSNGMLSTLTGFLLALIISVKWLS